MNLLKKISIGLLALAFLAPGFVSAASYDYDKQNDYEDELWDGGFTYIEYLSWSLKDTSAKNVVTDDGEDALQFIIHFTLTAKDEALYIPLSARRSSDEFFGGFTINYNIINGGIESPFTVNAIPDSETEITTTAKIVDGHAYIPAGASVDFTFNLIAIPDKETEGYPYNANVSFVNVETDEDKLYKNELEQVSLFHSNSYGLTNQLKSQNVTFTPGTGGDVEDVEEMKTPEVVLEDEDVSSNEVAVVTNSVTEEPTRQELLKQLQALLLQIIQLQQLLLAQQG